MTMHHCLSRLGSILLFLSGSFILMQGCREQRAPDKPNLLFVFSDQQSYDMLGCYGNEQVISPNLDQLASEGMLFTSCFSNSPVCTPFRGMLMSGQHSLYNGCFRNDVTLIPGNGKKFAEILRDEGYNTAYVGKWHLLGGDRDRPVPEGELRYGFDNIFYTNNCHVDYRPGKCFYWDENGRKVFFDTWEVYGQTEQALKYLEGRKGNDDPFALFVSWHPPHDWGLFDGEDGKKHYKYDTMEEFMDLYDLNQMDVRPGMNSNPDLQRMYHGYMGQVSGVDRAFGMLMDKLREIGEDKNTLVVFTSDHGDMLEFKGANKPKQYPHDYSLHIPFILRYPGIINQAQENGLLISALDMMPTILGLMELPVPVECHGKDLSEAILSGDENAVDYVPIWMYTAKNWRGVITKDYSYALAKDPDEQEELNILFDRSEDPYQLNNLFGDPELEEIQQELRALTFEWMDHYGDRFFGQSDFRNAKNDGDWIAPPFERPVDRLFRLEPISQ